MRLEQYLEAGGVDEADGGHDDAFDGRVGQESGEVRRRVDVDLAADGDRRGVDQVGAEGRRLVNGHRTGRVDASSDSVRCERVAAFALFAGQGTGHGRRRRRAPC